MNVLTLDSKTINIDEKYLHMSKLLMNVLNSEGATIDTDGNEHILVPLYAVNKNLLSIVLEFMNINYKVNDMKLPMPIPNEKTFHDIIGEQNILFFKAYHSKLFDLIIAADYMEIPLLLHLCCAKIAVNIKNYDLTSMREYFKIIDDFTPEQKRQAYKELEMIS